MRRELADNFCFYQPHYDSLQGVREWAHKNLMDHASDKQEHIYFGLCIYFGLFLEINGFELVKQLFNLQERATGKGTNS